MKTAEKQQQIEKHIQALMDILQIEKTDSTADTPKRVAKMLVDEICIGLDKTKFPAYKMFNLQENSNTNDPIVVSNIKIFSICEHHLLPFIGSATFKYVPNDKVIGLSKIPRIIDFLSRKPQLQERLTCEIFTTFSKILATDNISIELTCEHLCVKMRGAEDNCIMTTQKNGGCFKKMP